jgi:hypothetical protein
MQVGGGERSARRVDKIAEGTAARSRNEVGDMSAPVMGQIGRGGGRSEKGLRGSLCYWSWW